MRWGKGPTSTPGCPSSGNCPPGYRERSASFSICSTFVRRRRNPERAVRTALLLLLAGCSRGDGRTAVVLYSPHGPDQLGVLEKAFEAHHPEIDIRWLDMGSQEVFDRLRSERANPQADV